MTFETFDQSDEGTWPDQQKDNDKYKHKDNDNDNDNDKDKDKDKSAENINICYVFENLRIQGYQIW